jgi:hypothetical protein
MGRITCTLEVQHVTVFLVCPCRSERLAKYNQLLRIEEELGADAGGWGAAGDCGESLGAVLRTTIQINVSSHVASWSVTCGFGGVGM